ncbi:MAG: NRDE family protein [Flavobacteriales bacterium]|nr:MAG: NRDE family protein [Flavobacteriales bacterium]
MCTVSFAPIAGGGHVITSNRDEAVERHGGPPMLRQVGAVTVLAPTDGATGTTWIAAASNGRQAVLLNGSDAIMHFAAVPARSRGMILLEALTNSGPHWAPDERQLVGVHPFTLLCSAEDGLWMLQWSGTARTLVELDPLQPIIRSSTTLYEESVRAERQRRFDVLCAEGVPAPAELWAFHGTPHLDDVEQAFVMRRGSSLRTVSVTQIIVGVEGNASMLYQDLVGDAYSETALATAPH